MGGANDRLARSLTPPLYPFQSKLSKPGRFIDCIFSIADSTVGSTHSSNLSRVAIFVGGPVRLETGLGTVGAAESGPGTVVVTSETDSDSKPRISTSGKLAVDGRSQSQE